MHLTLFPYAENGPVMFIPAGQDPVDDVDVESGWEAFPSPLVRNLQRAGLSSESAAHDAADFPPPWTFLAVILLLPTTVRLLFTSRRPVIPLDAHRIAGAEQ